MPAVEVLSNNQLLMKNFVQSPVSDITLFFRFIRNQGNVSFSEFLVN